MKKTDIKSDYEIPDPLTTDLYDGTFFRHLEATDVIELACGKGFARADDPDVVSLYDGRQAHTDSTVTLSATSEHAGAQALIDETIADYDGHLILRSEAVPYLIREGGHWTMSKSDVEVRIANGNSGVDTPWSIRSLTYAEENGTLIHSNRYGEAHADNDLIVEHEISGDPIFRGDAILVYGDCWYRRDDEDVLYDYHSNPFIRGDDDYVVCEDTGEYHNRMDANYNEPRDCWYYEELSSSNTIINDWHDSPDPIIHPTTGWRVGFEVEKNSVCGSDECGDPVQPTDLFAGWERDGSCGVEGITNVYDPVDGVDLFEQHVKDPTARAQLNSDTADDCGGHINISHTSMSGREVLDLFRDVAAPLWYGLWLPRLKNTYSEHNVRLTEYEGATKYSVARVRNNGVVEIRLPNRIRTAEVLENRFALVGATCRAMDRGDKSIRPMYLEMKDILLNRMYRGHRHLLARAMRRARAIQHWFRTGHASHVVSDKVRSFRMARRPAVAVIDFSHLTSRGDGLNPLHSMHGSSEPLVRHMFDQYTEANACRRLNEWVTAWVEDNADLPTELLAYFTNRADTLNQNRRETSTAALRDQYVSMLNVLTAANSAA